MRAARASAGVRGAWIAIGALCLFACGADGGDEFNPPQDSFDSWCGELLCGWELDVGSIEPVRTWHPDDLGVSLLERPTQISTTRRNLRLPCLLFDMIAKVDTDAQLVLQLDFNVDGFIDFEQQVPDVPWKAWPFTVRAPTEYQGVRFILRKKGDGLAVIGQLRVLDQGQCGGEPLKLKPGSICETDAVCESGVCAAGNCQPCRDASCQRDAVMPLAAPGASE